MFPLRPRRDVIDNIVVSSGASNILMSTFVEEKHHSHDFFEGPPEVNGSAIT